MGKNTWIVCVFGALLSISTLTWAKGTPPAASLLPCNLFLQANGNFWAQSYPEFGERIASQHVRAKWTANIYNYRLLLAYHGPQSGLNPQWATPLFKAIQTQNKFHREFRGYMAKLLKFRPEQLLGKEAVLGHSMRHQLLGQITPILQNLTNHQWALPFFEDGFWDQLKEGLETLTHILKNPTDFQESDLIKRQQQLKALMANHATLIPPQVYTPKEKNPVEPTLRPNAFPEDLLLKLEKIQDQLQTMSFFIHPLYAISPAERFVLQLIYYRKQQQRDDLIFGNYYQAIDPIFNDLPFSQVGLTRILVELQNEERLRHPSLAHDQQISIPDYQKWQNDLVKGSAPNFFIHNLYRELFVTFLDARNAHEQYPDLKFHDFRVLVGLIQQRLDQLWQLDFQLAAPLHRIEIEHLQHALLIYDLRHRLPL